MYFSQLIHTWQSESPNFRFEYDSIYQSEKNIGADQAKPKNRSKGRIKRWTDRDTESIDEIIHAYLVVDQTPNQFRSFD